MSDLTVFRDHCRAMAAGEHAVGCESLTRPCRPPWRWDDDAARWVRPACSCGLSEADRALFGELAGQVDAYLAGDFGGHDAADLEHDQGDVELFDVATTTQAAPGRRDGESA